MKAPPEGQVGAPVVVLVLPLPEEAEVVNDCETPSRCIYCSALALGGAAVAG